MEKTQASRDTRSGLILLFFFNAKKKREFSIKISLAEKATCFCLDFLNLCGAWDSQAFEC